MLIRQHRISFAFAGAVMTLRAVVKNSRIGGRGVFASHAFTRGARLCKMRGEPISITELESRFRQGGERITCDPLAVGECEYISLWEPYLYINHSCEPNTGIVGKDTLVALRDIAHGEELTYDYSAVEWTPPEYTAYDYSLWPMICNCGSRHCRKIITCFPYLPLETRLRYLKSGLIQDHIVRRILGDRDRQRCLPCEGILKRNSLDIFSAEERKLAHAILIKSTVRTNMEKVSKLLPTRLSGH